MPRIDLIQHRRGTAAQWTAANPVLAAGEPGFEIDTGKEKIGDGTTLWSVLGYFLPESALNAAYAQEFGVNPHLAANGGAAGDGVTDDTDALTAALAVCALQGRPLRLMPGADYLISGPLEWDVPTHGYLWIEGPRAARITYDGGDAAIIITSPSGTAGLPRPMLRGFTLMAGVDALAAIRISDARGVTIDDMWIEGADAGALIELRCDAVYVEQTRILNCVLGAGLRAIDFVPASITGGGGTESFARTQVRGCIIAGGAAATALIRCRGGVYDSTFRDLGGNLTAGASLFALAGSMGGTVIDAIGIEGGDATSYAFRIGVFTGTAPKIGRVDARGDIGLIVDDTATGLDGGDMASHDLLGGIDVTGASTVDGALGVTGDLDVTGALDAGATTIGGDLAVTGALKLGAAFAASGAVRLPNNTSVKARNAAGSADVEIVRIGAADQIILGFGGATKTLVGQELEVDGALNHDGATVGFYGTAPIAKQTGVAVDAASIHAALVALGLIGA